MNSTIPQACIQQRIRTPRTAHMHTCMYNVTAHLYMQLKIYYTCGRVVEAYGAHVQRGTCTGKANSGHSQRVLTNNREFACAQNGEKSM